VGKSIIMRMIILAPLLALAGGVAAEQPPANPVAKAYQAHCESCHGPAMTGNSNGPSILAWIRYHTDAEVAALLGKGTGKMKPVVLSGEDRAALMGDLRRLADTNPTMATGGYTPERAARTAGGGRGGATPTAGPTTALPIPEEPSTPSRTGQHVSLRLSNGSTLAGKMLSDFTNAVTLLTDDGTIHLLARSGDTYTTKSLEPKANWTTYHGEVSGNRYSELEQINSRNISKLAPAWVFRSPTPNLTQGGFSAEATPLVVDGIMYTTAHNQMSALDATTGQLLWNFNLPRGRGVRSAAADGANRGPAIAGDRVFMVTDDAHLIALDRRSGAKLWDVQTGAPEDGVSQTAAPLVVGDLLYVGMTGGEEGARGFLDAYKAASGERAWRFWTIPARGEKNSETWIGAALEHGCGTTWLTGSYDAALDTLYWAIGNPCPDYNGEERKGDNLYTSSVVALNAKTGTLKWHYQFTPHDTHDWDAVQSLILVDETWQGTPRKLLLHGDRNGMFYVLDRTNGQFLLASKLSTKVTWNSGYTKDGRPILTSTFEATPEGVAICPGNSGGSNWHDASYSRAERLFYIRVTDGCGIYQSSPDPLNAGENRWYGGGRSPSPESQKALADLRADYPGGTFIRAMDPFTGKKAWDSPFTGRSGVLSTAGGLVFTGTPGGLTALDAKTGAKVWSVDVGMNTSASAMTYQVGGKQYIAISGTAAIVAYALP
jgi:alcohol dehydrogenase (cytochrome c)